MSATAGGGRARARPTALLWPRSTSAWLGVAAALVGAGLRVAIVPLFVAPLFDDVLQAHDLSALPRVLGTAGAVALGGSLALWAQDAALGRAAAHLGATWRDRLYADLLASPPGSLPGTSGALAGRVVSDLREVETYFRYGLGTLVAESATLLFILALLVRADATAALALFALALPGALVLRLVGRRLEGATRGALEGTEEVAHHLQEGLKHHELVRAFGAVGAMRERLGAANRRTARATARRSLIAGLQTPLTQLFVFTAIGVLVVILVGAVARGAATVGDVTAFLTLVALAATPTQLLPQGYAMYRQARAAARRLHALQGAAHLSPTAGAHPPAAAGDGPSEGDATPAPTSFTVARAHAQPGEAPLLALHGVAFGYDAARPVLAGVDLSFPRRGLVVVGGPSGSGKTTLLRLLLRFARPTAGRVTLDGVDLADVDEAALRSRLAYVPQGHELLSGALRDALAMGRVAEDGELWWALEAVGMARAVRALPAGLATRLAEDGGGFSGGQRQRLAVARALLGRPDAVLLDEPTSSLDDGSEAEINALLARLAKERLVLAVTHRPALAERADVLVLADGVGAPA